MYTATCKPPHSTGWVVDVERHDKRYDDPQEAKAAAQAYEDNAPIHVFGADVFFVPSVWALTPLSKEELVRQIRRLEGRGVLNVTAISEGGAVGNVGLFVKDGELWAKGEQKSDTYHDPDLPRQPLRRSRRLTSLRIAHR